MIVNIASRLETKTPLLRDLISDISSGEIKVPQFQRKFVWKEEQALKLLDSIASNYPIGSLLLWKTKSKLASERNIGAFKLPETDDLTPTDYVLDGQQRLTVIYSASDILQARLDGLIDVISNYRIPVVTLKELTVEEVCPIFERINSSGTKLSTYDLMVAATWTETFDLNEEAEKIAVSLKPKGFDDIDGNTVLKCLSAIKYKGIKKKQVLSLRTLSKADMDALVTIAKSAMLKTVDLLTTEFKIYSWDFLPYEAIAVVLCYIFSKRKTLTLEDIKRVKIWFWRSAFTERYRGASESFISQDLDAIDDYVVNAEDPTKSFGALPSAQILMRLAFRSNNSRSRAFAILLALKSPKNLTNGALIDSQNALSCYNEKQFHHIYPKAYLKRIKSPGEHNSLINMCMLAASENNIISDSVPNDYLPNLVESLGEDAANVFESNYFPNPDNVDYSSLSYLDFLELRSQLIYADIEALANGKAI
jgi:hypothetical protein